MRKVFYLLQFSDEESTDNQAKGFGPFLGGDEINVDVYQFSDKVRAAYQDLRKLVVVMIMMAEKVGEGEKSEAEKEVDPCLPGKRP